MDNSNLLKLFTQAKEKNPQALQSLIEVFIQKDNELNESSFKSNSLSSTRKEVGYNIYLCSHSYYRSIYKLRVTNQLKQNPTM